MKNSKHCLITSMLLGMCMLFPVGKAMQSEDIAPEALIKMQQTKLQSLNKQKIKLENEIKQITNELDRNKKIPVPVRKLMEKDRFRKNTQLEKLNHDYEFLKKTHEKYIKSQSPLSLTEQSLSFARTTMKKLEPQTKKLEQQLTNIESKIKAQSNILSLSDTLNNPSQIHEAFQYLSQSLMSLKTIDLGPDPVKTFFSYLEQCINATQIKGHINLNNPATAKIFISKMDYYTLFFYTKIPDIAPDIITFVFAFLFIADNLKFHPLIIDTLERHCAVSILTYITQTKDYKPYHIKAEGDLSSLPENVQLFWPQLKEDLKEKIRIKYSLLTTENPRWIDKLPAEASPIQQPTDSRWQRVWNWFKSLPKTAKEKVKQALQKLQKK